MPAVPERSQVTETETLHGRAAAGWISAGLGLAFLVLA